jgi:16S rRNA processing protein RimM
MPRRRSLRPKSSRLKGRGLRGIAEPMKLVMVGRVAGAFGVRGELRITTYTEDPLAVLRYRDLKRDDGTPALTLQGARVAKGGVIARVKEVGDKDQADRLRGLRLYVGRDALAPPDDDESARATS